MLRRLAPILALCLSTGVLAACGGDDGGDDGGSAAPTPAATTPAETTETSGGDDSAAAEQRFASLGCASCHTLAAADASGQTGPNLDETKPDADRVESKVRSGGGGMPSFGEDRISDEELAELADYVSSVAGE